MKMERGKVELPVVDVEGEGMEGSALSRGWCLQPP